MSDEWFGINKKFSLFMFHYPKIEHFYNSHNHEGTKAATMHEDYYTIFLALLREINDFAISAVL